MRNGRLIETADFGNVADAEFFYRDCAYYPESRAVGKGREKTRKVFRRFHVGKIIQYLFFRCSVYNFHQNNINTVTFKKNKHIVIKKRLLYFSGGLQNGQQLTLPFTPLRRSRQGG